MPRRFLAVLAAAVPALALPACAGTPPAPVTPAVVAPPAPGPETRFRVLMINGGGNPDINFQPHLLHLRTMREMLLASGIPADRITVFSSDGDDAGPDLVSRAEQPEKDFWILRNTRVQHALEMPRVLVSSAIPGVQMQPATKAGLKKWFDDQAVALKPGDTLLVYVTDHGNKGADPTANSIQLWGKDEVLSVKDFGELLHAVPAGVRVVNVMSQCFSGGFAGLSTPSASGTSANVCGYFASTADRPAYGCFPENIGKERVGHSFHFLRGLASDRRMSTAHAETLVVDDTPDVPVRSSDARLAELLTAGAKERSVTVEAFASELLGPTWRDKPEWHAERELADRIAGEYGMVSPASLPDAETQHHELVDLQRGLAASAQSWGSALSDSTGENLERFIAANPAWKDRLSDEALKNLGGDAARSLTASLLGELLPWTRKERGDKLDLIEGKKIAAEEAVYRTEVRIAVALRLKILLTTLAGRAYLERYGTPAQRDELTALRACEDVVIPGSPASSSPAAPEQVPAYASITDDWRLEHELTPPWIGISFTPDGVREDVRKEHGLPDGVSLITGVIPSSPAKEAGLQPGDLILGPPDRPFTAHNEIRIWTMTSPPGQKGTIKVQRGDKQVEITLEPRPHPANAPPPPAVEPLAIGAPAPPMNLRSYRGGNVNLKDGKSHLIVFWETWCGPCKASMPEVLAYERARNVEVVAITDEAPATLDKFFTQWKAPFPKNVAIDDLHTAHFAIGVPATPTYVLIDGKGIVRARGVGYGRPQGLAIDGWKWNPPPAPKAKAPEKTHP